jgi:hypothetical protein
MNVTGLFAASGDTPHFAVTIYGARGSRVLLKKL